MHTCLPYLDFVVFPAYIMKGELRRLYWYLLSPYNCSLCSNPSFHCFFFLFLSVCPAVDVDAVDVARGDRGSLDLTNVGWSLQRKHCSHVSQSGRGENRRMRLSLNRWKTEFVFSAAMFPHLIHPHLKHGGVPQCPSGFWRWNFSDCIALYSQ